MHSGGGDMKGEEGVDVTLQGNEQDVAVVRKGVAQ